METTSAQTTVVNVPYLGQVDPVVLTAWATVALAIFTILLVIATAVLVGVTAFFMRSQERRSSELHGFDMLMKLRDEFFSERYLISRDRAARLLLSSNLRPTVEYSNHLNRISNFFERLEQYISIGVLDEEMAWFSFENYVVHYYPCLKAYIAKRRARHPATFANIANLQKRFQRIGRMKASIDGEYDTDPSDEDLRTFLENEMDNRQMSSAVESRASSLSEVRFEWAPLIGVFLVYAGLDTLLRLGRHRFRRRQTRA